LGWHTVAVVQYTEYRERNIHNNQTMLLSNLGSAGHGPSLRIIPWNSPYNRGKTSVKVAARTKHAHAQYNTRRMNSTIYRRKSNTQWKTVTHSVPYVVFYCHLYFLPFFVFLFFFIYSLICSLPCSLRIYSRLHFHIKTFKHNCILLHNNGCHQNLYVCITPNDNTFWSKHVAFCKHDIGLHWLKVVFGCAPNCL
jgi:hypothetical protein